MNVRRSLLLPLLLAFSVLCYGRSFATEISFTHDALSRPVEKRIDDTRVKAWLWIDSLRIAAEFDATNAVTARFIYAGRANVPSYAIKGTNTYRLLADPRGSVRLVVNVQSGEIAQRLDYDEWGRVTRDTNPGFQPFGFAGGLYNPDTGLVRFGARDYDAETARWTRKDPIGFRGDQANLYAYVNNDPVNRGDAVGLQSTIANPGAQGAVVPVGAGGSGTPNGGGGSIIPVGGNGSIVPSGGGGSVIPNGGGGSIIPAGGDGSLIPAGVGGSTINTIDAATPTGLNDIFDVSLPASLTEEEKKRFQDSLAKMGNGDLIDILPNLDLCEPIEQK
ncbi:MAG: RHS repeat-associated core domain-containing protein [Verrucomicrobiales bacterium]|nr:RHS repeat-associated core domain-containing protein [Verrucomicrobiales bacterium]